VARSIRRLQRLKPPRTLNHKTLSGESIPTLAAAEDELANIATAIGATGTGWL
jgi:hypothetical protein